MANKIGIVKKNLFLALSCKFFISMFSVDPAYKNRSTSTKSLNYEYMNIWITMKKEESVIITKFLDILFEVPGNAYDFPFVSQSFYWGCGLFSRRQPSRKTSDNK